MSVIDWPSFILGAGLAFNVYGAVLWVTVLRVRREDMAWRREARKRIDDLAEVSERRYNEARREIGLPPKVRS